jgi:undecaprenyl-diphosphatase
MSGAVISPPQAAVYGVLQGLTEFLPVSSTAHLRVVPALLQWDDPGAAFTAVTQIGTLAAVLLYFRRDILRMTRAFITGLRARAPLGTADARMAWMIGVGTIPIVLAGVLLKPAIEGPFRSLHVIAFALIGLAVLLGVAEFVGKRKRSIEALGWRDAVLVGLAQAVALVPGSSRSGTTITMALFLDIDRAAAARFSFLLSIPAVTLSGLYELWDIRHTLQGDAAVSLVVAVIVAGVVGYASIAFLLRFLRIHSTAVFIAYRVGLGALILVLLHLHYLVP